MPLVLLAAALIAGWAAAAGADDCLGIAARRIETGAPITLHLASGDTLRAHFAGADETSVLLAIAGTETTLASPRAVALNEISSITFRDATRPRILYAVGGMFVGGIAGGLIGAGGGGGELGGVSAVGAGLLGSAVGTVVGIFLPIDVHYDRLVACHPPN